MTWRGRAAVPVSPAVVPAPTDTEADRLLTTLLAALSKVEAILGGWALIRIRCESDVPHDPAGCAGCNRPARETALVDGLFEVRGRLVQGLPKEMER